MVKASARWLGVRMDLLAALLISTVAIAAVLVSQDAGRYIHLCRKITIQKLLTVFKNSRQAAIMCYRVRN